MDIILIFNMTLGIAIPCSSGHVKYIPNLLNEIAKSTVLPLQVSISISSYDDEISLDSYPFEVIITKDSNDKNASMNRNIAGSKLTTDIICFFDCDDLPHYSRNEYLLESFKLGASATVHDYEMSLSDIKEYENSIGEKQIYIDYIDTFITDTHAPSSSKEHLPYANGHISVLKKIFDLHKFNENSTWSEDCEFNSQIIKMGYKISYINNKLSYYRH